MDVVSVTLNEIFAAAKSRGASLVPETSGYLALSVADASLRLPYLVEGDHVTLTSEGSVKVMRGTAAVGPEEVAKSLRASLTTLLDLSIGRTSGLTQAAKPKTDDSVDRVIHDLESALVPVNRTAARRALARLARETYRAKSSGKLDKILRASEASKPPTATGQAPSKASAVAADTRQIAAVERAQPRPNAACAPEPILWDIDVEVDEPASPTPEPVRFELNLSDGPSAVADRPSADEHAKAGELQEADLPTEPETSIDTEMAERVRCAEDDPDPTDPKPVLLGDVSLDNRSNVEDLLLTFGASDAPSLTQTRSRLKRLAGLDATPPPPSAEWIARVTNPAERANEAASEPPLKNAVPGEGRARGATDGVEPAEVESSPRPRPKTSPDRLVRLSPSRTGLRESFLSPKGLRALSSSREGSLESEVRSSTSGLDATSSLEAPDVASSASEREDLQMPATTLPISPGGSTGRAKTAVWIAVGLVVAGLLGHFVPNWMSSRDRSSLSNVER